MRRRLRLLIAIFLLASVSLFLFLRESWQFTQPTAALQLPPAAQIPETTSSNSTQPTTLPSRLSHQTTSLTVHENTEAEQARVQENNREWERMRQALPDNRWLPKPLSAGQGEKYLKEFLISNRNIHHEQATLEQKKQFFSLEIRDITDKIKMIQYIQQRTQQLAAETHQVYLSPADIEQGNQEIERLQQMITAYQATLDQLTQAASTNKGTAQ